MNWSCADRIFLRGLRAHARVGSCDRSELLLLDVDLEVSIDLRNAAVSDNLADTANYADIASVVLESLSRPYHSSLAAASAILVEELLGCDGRFEEIRLTLRNRHLVLDSTVDSVGISIVHKRR